MAGFRPWENSNRQQHEGCHAMQSGSDNQVSILQCLEGRARVKVLCFQGTGYMEIQHLQER